MGGMIRGGLRGPWGGVALALALCLGGGQARAADAAGLEAQLHDWLAGMLGPRVKLPDRPVRVTEQGDGFALSIPFAGPIGDTGVTLGGTPITATTHTTGDGRWAVDDIRLPSPFTVAVPDKGGTRVWTVTVQDQNQHAVIDPSLATTSSWDSQIGGYSMRSQGPGGERHTEAAHIVTHSTLQPAAGGRVDLTETASSDLISSTTDVPKLGQMSFSAAHSRFDAHFDGVSPQRVPQVVHAVVDLIEPLAAAASAAAANGTKPPPPTLTPEMRASLKALAEVAGDLLNGYGEQVRLEDVHLHGPMGDASLKRLEVGTSVAAPDGRLRMLVPVVLDGLDSAALRDGPLHDYLPRHIALTPRVSGLQADRVAALLRHAAAANGDDPALEKEADAIVHDGPLAIGLDTLAADFGPATLAASGEMHILGRDQVSGHAHVRMTGLNDLIRDAQTVPMLQQAVPVLIFLKGIGQTEGSSTVWNIAYDGARLTVNGTDMSQMMPGK